MILIHKSMCCSRLIIVALLFVATVTKGMIVLTQFLSLIYPMILLPKTKEITSTILNFLWEITNNQLFYLQNYYKLLHSIGHLSLMLFLKLLLFLFLKRRKYLPHNLGNSQQISCKYGRKYTSKVSDVSS